VNNSKKLERLNEEVARLYTLSLVAKQVHWNVEGQNFLSIHQLLDTLATELRDIADETAERSSALGSVPEISPHTLVAQSFAGNVPSGKVSTEEAAKYFRGVLGEQIDSLVELAKTISGSDPITQDICIASARKLSKLQWLFQAHLS